MATASSHADVIIVGAGLSGIGAAAHLQDRCPGKTFLILEARDVLGGTWDLFRYPGVRSDSDMYTLGYAFKPWTDPKAIADGPAILAYIAETARERGLDQGIHFGHRVVAARWSSAEGLWTVEAEHQGERRVFTCRVLDFCSGYYAYDEGHRPRWPGEADFQGVFVHPQAWPDDLDYRGRRVVVIGSGATAVTLVPAMARTAAHVTMLQRSPTYVFSRPGEDGIANVLRRWLPPMVAYQLVRAKNIGIGALFFTLSRRRPDGVRRWLIGEVAKALGPGVDVQKHFAPRYNPWDQRLCLVPDGDLFEALKAGTASVVTDEIDAFTADGIRLVSGEHLEADVVVTATGLRMKVFDGVDLSVDGKAIDLPRHLVYKGMMLDGVPNLMLTFGYTNASWTLKADLTSAFLCRVLAHMDRAGLPVATPRIDGPVDVQPLFEFTSGYVQRAVAGLPRQGRRKPWRLYQNYVLDWLMLRRGRLDDGTLRFTRPEAVVSR
jgi:cation diffusion facilitator CzcD-associated flavoprotein CzcO